MAWEGGGTGGHGDRPAVARVPGCAGDLMVSCRARGTTAERGFSRDGPHVINEAPGVHVEGRGCGIPRQWWDRCVGGAAFKTFPKKHVDAIPGLTFHGRRCWGGGRDKSMD